MAGLAPSALLAPDALLPPSSGSTIYIDAPIGHIGGTLVVGGGGIVKVGGTSVNQEPQRRQPRTYPQQAPPRLIHVSYQIGHDAPTGRISLGGTLGETFVPGTSRLSRDAVCELERRFRLVYRIDTDQPETGHPSKELSRDLLAPFTGVKT